MSESADSVWSVLSTCSVCGKQLDSDSGPQLLPCCHSSCKDCIEDNRNQMVDFCNTNERPEFKCKVCSEEYDPNECIENSFQLLYWSKKDNNETNDDHICQSCEEQNRAVIKCETCDWICEECETLHKTIKVFKGHKLDDSSKISSRPVLKNVCETHNEEITVYCKTCRTPYCARCILKDHNLHVYEDTRDGTQLQEFYENLTKKVEQIKEKRSFAENMLQKFETFESDISESKSECVNKIKTIVTRLEEKVKELGTSLLEKVSDVCQRKEREFNEKKTELNQMNGSFKYIEQFMAAIMELNDPMGVMKAQDLLTQQLEKLLNKPCSHPDFIQPFKIEVVDALAEDNTDGQAFDVSKMIDGVFNMCYKIVSSDDQTDKNEATSADSAHNNDTDNSPDDDMSDIIVLPNPNTNRVPQKMPSVPPALIRGNNRENQMLTKMLSTSSSREHMRQQSNSFDCSYPNYTTNPNNANFMQTIPPARPISNATHVPTQRLQSNSSMHLQNLNALTNAVPNVSQSLSQMSNNFVTQTGIAVNSPVVGTNAMQTYGSPQVYRGPVPNQLVQNSVLIPTSVPNTLNIVSIPSPPNVTIQPSNHVIYNTSANQQGLQQTTYSHNLRTYAGGNISVPILALNTNPPQYKNTSMGTGGQPIQPKGTTTPTVIYANTNRSISTNSPLRHMLSNNYQNQSQSHSTLSAQQYQQNLIQRKQLEAQRHQQEIQKQQHIQRIKQQLYDQTPDAFSADALTKRVIDIINSEREREERQQTISDTNLQSLLKTQNALTNTFSPANRPQPLQPQVTMQLTRGYSLHIPDGTAVTPVAATEPERSASRESVSQRRDSGQSCVSTPGRIETNQTTNSRRSSETVGAIESRSHSTDSGIQTPTLSMPILSDVSIDSTEKSLPNDNQEVVTNQNANQTESIGLESNPLPTPSVSNPPSVDSVLSPTNSNSNDILVNEERNANNKDDNREAMRSAAPVARIAPITNESETPDPRIDELSDDNQSIDEDADCVVCNEEYGEFICCSACPRAFHIHCHVPELQRMPESTFICTFCKSIPQTESTGRTRRSGLNDRQQLICERILIGLLCHKKSSHFKPPFSENIQHIYTLIGVKKNLQNKKYENEIEFIDHIKRVFSHYKNREITPEDMADYNTLEKYFRKMVHKLWPTFMEALQNNSSNNSSIESNGCSNSKKNKSTCISI